MVELAFVMAEWADPGAPAGPPRLIAPFHVHYTDDEAWYVMVIIEAMALALTPAQMGK